MADRTRQVRRRTSEAARVAASQRGVGQLARAGYFSIGIVYVTIGVLAFLGLFGIGSGQYTGSTGATRTILSQPFGRVLLGVVGAGLVTYVVWRVAQSVFDVEGRGRSTDGFLRRAGLALSALSYAGITFEIVRLFVTGGGGISNPKADWTRALMGHPAGLVLMGLVGLGVLVVAGVQFRGAYRASFLDQMTAKAGARRSMNVLGRLGFGARGVVFGIIGGFLLISVFQANPEQAKGLGGALRTLGRQPYGRFLIGAVASGLLCYGFFMLAKARFRKLVADEQDGSFGEEASREDDQS